jgi:hypothetical protein
MLATDRARLFFGLQLQVVTTFNLSCPDSKSRMSELEQIPVEFTYNLRA